MPLKVSDGIGAWVKDFQKSDAPQFKGKSKDERRDQAVAAYLSAKRGDQKEGYMPNYADKMKKKMITPSDKSKLLKIRQMLDKEKKPVRKEAMTPAQKAAHDKAIADFKKRGGKITKLPPGKAAGWHGKDDLGSGMKGMLAKGSAKKLGLRRHGKHLDTSTPIHRESVQEDFMFKVGVEGLPDMIIGGSSPGDIKARMRKIVKQPSMITSVSRMTSSEVKKRYRDMAQGKEDTNEMVDPMDLRGRPKKPDPYPNSPYGIKHPLHPANLAKKKNNKKTKTEATWPAEMPNEELNEAPGIVTKNVAAAKADIQKATRALNSAVGKSERPLTRSIMNAIKALKTASKELE